MSNVGPSDPVILLVDDDATTNFLHKRAIRKAHGKVDVREASNGAEAIDHLREALTRGEDPPSFIFLDINMPKLDGWGFLDAYRELPDDWRKRSSLLMLTTSLNPDDHEKADKYPEVKGVIDKMLNSDRFKEIISEYAFA